MNDSSFTRKALVFWVTAIGVAALISVAIGVAASIESGGQDPASSAPTEEPPASLPTDVGEPRPRSSPAQTVPTPTQPETGPGRTVFTGQGGKATETFQVEKKSFTVRWRTESEDANAFFYLSVFEVGQAFPVGQASFRGAGVDSTVVRAGPGDFYLEVVTGMGWQVEVVE